MDWFDLLKKIFNQNKYLVNEILGKKLTEVKKEVRGGGIFSYRDPARKYTTVVTKFPSA